MIVMFPVALFVEIGAKVIVALVVCPAAKVKGKESPLIAKPAPVILTCEIVTLAVPVFCRITGNALLLPSGTFPKARLVGFTESRSVAPVPESDTVTGEFVALLTIEMLPVALLPAVGAKVALKDVLWPAARVRGRVSPL